MFTAIYSYVTAAVGLLSIVALAWWAGRPNRMRDSEEAARAHFDAHGRWPDEKP